MNWLFLRGEWDERTQKSIDDNDDMWLQLFAAIGNGDVYFRGHSPAVDYNKYTHIFSRGGFDWQTDICRKFNGYKIRYGAGRRFMPENDIKYDLVLVDSYNQKKEILSRFPDCNVQIWIKPAAEHFRYMPEIKKEYDVCYIANGQQAVIKSIEWVYDTVPSDLKVLHLGYPSRYKVPANVTCMCVDRIDMPLWINKCKIGIVPYWSGIDSCPRIIPEMMACGLPLIMADTVVYRNRLFTGGFSNQSEFWKDVRLYIEYDIFYLATSICYKEECSIEVAVNLIKQYMSGLDVKTSCKI